MSYISTVNFNLPKEHPFPYNVPAIKYCQNIDLSNKINFIIGENGTGKSTLVETIAFRLQLPHMDGSNYSKRAFRASAILQPFMKIDFDQDRPVGFFFRAEDFGDFLNSVVRQDSALHAQLNSLHGEVPENIIQEMKDNANMQIHHVRKNYGQELHAFSHGEAYLKIINEKIKGRGIYILDEPEAALSPTKQLSLIYFILEHLKNNNSQFIIATHSPILMSIPSAKIHEVSEQGMQHQELEDTEHFRITQSFLNNPEMYLRHLSDP